MPSFFTSYVSTALGTSDDDNGQPLDKNYGPTNIAPETLARMMDDCEAFQRKNRKDLASIDAGQAGHDFWLTRNGHGAGFWDGDYEETVGERLTKSSESFGTFDLYIGDDGQIYGM
jgi:hypothetical protein